VCVSYAVFETVVYKRIEGTTMRRIVSDILDCVEEAIEQSEISEQTLQNFNASDLAKYKLTPDQENLMDAVFMISSNDGAAYAKRDAKGATVKAIKEYLDSKVQELKDDLKTIEGPLVKELVYSWKRK
jgi:hypothetical protein